MQGSGDQKFIPGVSDGILQKLADRSPALSSLYDGISTSIRARPPFSLGYPSESTQSSYYLGSTFTEEDIAAVSKVLEQNGIFPENTRIRKAENSIDYEVLIASVQERGSHDVRKYPLPDGKSVVTLILGDHSPDLARICTELSEALKYAANDRQKAFIAAYIDSFQTGSLESYRDSQRIWVRDKAPRVENIFGFVEPYRDPHGVRSEFEGLVAIADDGETKLLARLAEHSATFIRRLPWASAENDGKGPFEKSLFDPPDFSSIHSQCKSANGLCGY